MCGAAAAPAKIQGAIARILSDFCPPPLFELKRSKQTTFCAEQSNVGSLDFGNSQFSQIIECRIVERGRASRIVDIAGRNEDNHALPRPREQNSVRVAQINAIVRIRDVAPAVAAEIVIMPS